MSYTGESIFDFPLGLPAFEDEKQFVFIELPANAPLIFLQSLANPGLCFLAFPIMVLDQNYQLDVSIEQLQALDFAPGSQPQLGSDLLVLALLSLREGIAATANLMAPIVVNLQTQRALQAIRCDTAYSHAHPVPTRATKDAC